MYYTQLPFSIQDIFSLNLNGKPIID